MIPLLFSALLAVAPPLSETDLEREAHALEAMLIAPCCFSQQVSVHQSPAAGEVRRDVRARLAAGQTRQQILDAYVAEHGKRILAEPPAEGFDLALYVAPFVMFVASLVFVTAVVRRLTQSHGGSVAEDPPVPQPSSNPADDAKLDDALRDLD